MTSLPPRPRYPLGMPSDIKHGSRSQDRDASQRDSYSRDPYTREPYRRYTPPRDTYTADRYRSDLPRRDFYTRNSPRHVPYPRESARHVPRTPPKTAPWGAPAPAPAPINGPATLDMKLRRVSELIQGINDAVIRRKNIFPPLLSLLDFFPRDAFHARSNATADLERERLVELILPQLQRLAGHPRVPSDAAKEMRATAAGMRDWLKMPKQSAFAPISTSTSTRTSNSTSRIRTSTTTTEAPRRPGATSMDAIPTQHNLNPEGESHFNRQYGPDTAFGRKRAREDTPSSVSYDAYGAYDEGLTRKIRKRSHANKAMPESRAHTLKTAMTTSTSGHHPPAPNRNLGMRRMGSILDLEDLMPTEGDANPKSKSARVPEPATVAKPSPATVKISPLTADKRLFNRVDKDVGPAPSPRLDLSATPSTSDAVDDAAASTTPSPVVAKDDAASASPAASSHDAATSGLPSPIASNEDAMTTPTTPATTTSEREASMPLRDRDYPVLAEPRACDWKAASARSSRAVSAGSNVEEDDYTDSEEDYNNDVEESDDTGVEDDERDDAEEDNDNDVDEDDDDNASVASSDSESSEIY